MSNPLYSCLVSDPGFPPEPAARAAGPPKTATPGQYRRDLPGHASEQVPMTPPRGIIFRIWSTEIPEPLIGGIGEDRLIRHRFAQTAGVGYRARSGPNPDAVCTAVVRPNTGSIRPGEHSGLARRPNSGNMDRPWCRRCDLPFIAAGTRSGAQIGKRHGFCSCAAFQVRAQGPLARFHELRQ
jgi:hypothetical protein